MVEPKHFNMPSLSSLQRDHSLSHTELSKLGNDVPALKSPTLDTNQTSSNAQTPTGVTPMIQTPKHGSPPPPETIGALFSGSSSRSTV